MMTRRDFTGIAESIARCLDAQRAYPHAREAVIGVALDLANLFARLNPRFNRERFLKACNVPESQEDSDESS